MSAEQLVTYLTWAIFLLLSVVTTITAVHFPLRSNLHTALLFAMPAAIILIAIAARFELVQPGPWINAFSSALLLTVAYLMLWLVQDFDDVPGWLMRAAEVGLALLALGGFLFQPPRPAWYNITGLLYFVGLHLYAAFAFVRAARQAVGVTRRRLRMIATGSLLLGVTIASSLLGVAGVGWRIVFEGGALGAGICYFLGFAPPQLLRRTWQEPELRAFLRESIVLPRLNDDEAVIRTLEERAAAITGAPIARIGLWNEQRKLLLFVSEAEMQPIVPDMAEATGRAFLTQQPVLSMTRPAGLIHPGTGSAQPQAVLAAPISSREQRFGVLTVYTHREALFAEDDVDLIGLVAVQAAAVLESRQLITELARVRAREEAARLKEDFLSAAAHDLKTPLTTLVAQTQHLERQLQRNPAAPVNLRSISLLVQEAQRLRSQVSELLDAARAERGQLVGVRELVDLVELAHEVCSRHQSPRHPCRIEADGVVAGFYDRSRIEQMLSNLIDNAIKFSPNGGVVRIAVQHHGQEAVIIVDDHGIGIPADDLPYVFERFFRASNVNDRNYAGMGLSLFICRAIAEQHGGRIWVESKLGRGSTFQVALPLSVYGGSHGYASANPGRG